MARIQPLVPTTRPKYNIHYTRPTLYRKQEEAIFSSARLICVEASTKSGKTFGALVWIFEMALMGRRHGIYWWVAPIYAQAKIAFLRLLHALEGNEIIKSIDHTNMVVTIITGATIHFKSGERPDSLFGEDVDAAVIDEASRLREESFTAVRSTLTATRGPILCIANVRGKQNWFYKLCRRIEYRALRNAAYAKLTAYDAIAAGVIDKEEIEEAKELLPDSVFKELYLAIASDDGSNPFGAANIEKCVISSLSPLEPVCYGIDLGKAVDYTVIIGLDTYGQVCHIERYQREWTETVLDISTMPNIPMMIDSTGVGDAPVEFIQKAKGLDNKVQGFKFTATTKQPLMEELALSMARQEILFPEGIIKEELDIFEYEYSRTGIKFSAPVGFHDDAVMALALANRMKRQLANMPYLMIARV